MHNLRSLAGTEEADRGDELICNRDYDTLTIWQSLLHDRHIRCWAGSEESEEPGPRDQSQL